MQPHSMAAIMLAHYYWNHDNPKKKDNGEISVVYTGRDGLYQTKYYKFYNVEESKDRLELKATYSARDGQCTVTARRRSPTAGSEGELIHSEQHASGLRERYKMYEKQLMGYHENSLKYRGIRGSLDQPYEITFENEIRRINDSNQFTVIRYTVRLQGG